MLHAPTLDTDELRPTHLQVDLGQLAHNYRAIDAFVGEATNVMPILKANAYGHGLVEVARRLQTLGAPYVGVAYLEEGVRLRREGITTPILVLGGLVGEQIPRFLEHDLTLAASSVDKLRAIDACAAATGRRAKVHLKIDTGMERIGVHWYSAEKLLEESLRVSHVEVEGIFTHFANADEADLSHARLQLERFHEVLSFYEARSLPTPLRHAANSGAILQLPESHFDLVRPGILFYGVSPSPAVNVTIDVRGALRWSTRVVYFKVVEGGHPVSYGSTWAPEARTRLVTLPVGYGDGYPRGVARRGPAEVIVRGERRPIVGRVCMDQLMVDLGPEGTAYNGDEVVLLGREGDREITCEELAAWSDTITHDVLVSINTRVPRVYVG
ncbi:MAG: alanine racemase [Myxococcales bacterium]|nr:alanine racemase [Myxococcales bacterium]